MPEKADAAYLFGHTRQRERVILETGADLYCDDKVGILAVCKLAPGYPHNGPADNPTYRDAEAWKSELMTLGVQKNDILAIESPRATLKDEKFPVSHTGTEAKRFVLLAKIMGWESVFIVSHPMHMLRAYVQTVGFAMKEYPTLKVYAKTNSPGSWHTHGTLNQGVASGMPFMEGVDEEWKHLNTAYGNKYDPIPPAQVIEYINWRETEEMVIFPQER